MNGLQRALVIALVCCAAAVAACDDGSSSPMPWQMAVDVSSGANWKFAATAPYGDYRFVGPVGGGMLVVEEGRVFRWTSRDGWESVPDLSSLDPRDSPIIAGLAQANGAHFALLKWSGGEAAYLYRSDDNGRSWSRMGEVDVAAMLFGDGDWLYAVDRSHSSPRHPLKLYRSGDGGQSWALVRDDVVCFDDCFVADDMIVTTVVLDEESEETARVYSLDGGDSWQPVPSGPKPVAAGVGVGAAWYALDKDGRLLRSSDRLSWEYAQTDEEMWVSSLTAFEGELVALIDGGKLVTLDAEVGRWRSFDASVDGERHHHFNSSWLYAAAGELFVGAHEAGLWRLSDDSTWQPSNPLPGTPWEVVEHDGAFFAPGLRFMSSWSGEGDARWRIHLYPDHRDEPDTARPLMFGSHLGELYGYDPFSWHISRFDADSASFRVLAEFEPPLGRGISDVASDKAALFVSLPGRVEGTGITQWWHSLYRFSDLTTPPAPNSASGVFRSVDGGQTFSPYNEGLEVMHLPSRGEDSSGGEQLYANAHPIDLAYVQNCLWLTTGFSGVFRRCDADVEWESAAKGLPPHHGELISFEADDERRRSETPPLTFVTGGDTLLVHTSLRIFGWDPAEEQWTQLTSAAFSADRADDAIENIDVAGESIWIATDSKLFGVHMPSGQMINYGSPVEGASIQYVHAGPDGPLVGLEGELGLWRIE